MSGSHAELHAVSCHGPFGVASVERLATYADSCGIGTLAVVDRDGILAAGEISRIGRAGRHRVKLAIGVTVTMVPDDEEQVVPLSEDNNGVFDVVLLAMNGTGMRSLHRILSRNGGWNHSLTRQEIVASRDGILVASPACRGEVARAVDAMRRPHIALQKLAAFYDYMEATPPASSLEAEALKQEQSRIRRCVRAGLRNGIPVVATSLVRALDRLDALALDVVSALPFASRLNPPYDGSRPGAHAMALTPEEIGRRFDFLGERICTLVVEIFPPAIAERIEVYDPIPRPAVEEGDSEFRTLTFEAVGKRTSWLQKETDDGFGVRISREAKDIKTLRAAKWIRAVTKIAAFVRAEGGTIGARHGLAASQYARSQGIHDLVWADDDGQYLPGDFAFDHPKGAAWDLALEVPMEDLRRIQRHLRIAFGQQALHPMARRSRFPRASDEPSMEVVGSLRKTLRERDTDPSEAFLVERALDDLAPGLGPEERKDLSSRLDGVAPNIFVHTGRVLVMDGDPRELTPVMDHGEYPLTVALQEADTFIGRAVRIELVKSPTLSMLRALSYGMEMAPNIMIRKALEHEDLWSTFHGTEEDFASAGGIACPVRCLGIPIFGSRQYWKPLQRFRVESLEDLVKVYAVVEREFEPRSPDAVHFLRTIRIRPDFPVTLEDVLELLVKAGVARDLARWLVRAKFGSIPPPLDRPDSDWIQIVSDGIAEGLRLSNRGIGTAGFEAELQTLPCELIVKAFLQASTRLVSRAEALQKAQFAAALAYGKQAFPLEFYWAAIRVAGPFSTQDAEAFVEGPKAIRDLYREAMKAEKAREASPDRLDLLTIAFEARARGVPMEIRKGIDQPLLEKNRILLPAEGFGR